MIIGLGGGGLGISRQQAESLKSFLKRLPVDAAVHRGRTGMETMIHNIVRSIYPRIPIHVVPIIDVFTILTFKPPPHTIVYQAGTPDEVNPRIVQVSHGIIFLPNDMREGGDGWDLPYEAREQAVAVFYIWPNGKLSLERNEL